LVMGNSENTLPSVVKTITQGQLQEYAQVSGDFNPLHLDEEFAASTQFGGIIAHGMLTLAFISEMMLSAFGRAWLESGALKVRFKGAAYVGDQVETWGRVTKEEQHPLYRLLTCSVGVCRRGSGEEIISGTATVKLP
jgi:3-hydroxybutyryl-CoA dehydratase